MRHGREDYQRITDPAADQALLAAWDAGMNELAQNRDTGERIDAYGALNALCRALGPILSDIVRNPVPHPIGQDEPVFLLRASDPHAPDTVRRWAELQYDRGKGDSGRSISAREHADTMENWRLERDRAI